MKSLFRPTLALALAASLLTACGGSSTTLIERDPVPNDDDDHHHHHGEMAGRLLISEKDDDHLYVFDLEDEAIIEEFHLGVVPTALYASPSKRYGIVVRGGDGGQVNFVDSGLYWEDHGDHGHLRETAPALMDLELLGDRPAHVTQFDDQVAIFFDGNSGTPAQVQVLDDHDIAHNHEPAHLTYTVNQHGAAQVRGEYLFSTVRDPDLLPETTLPTRVALYHRHDDHFDFEEEFDVECPGLHGSAQNHHYVAFGCTDGVLLIEVEAHDDHYHFDARKLAFDQRISTLYGHEALDAFIGIASGNLYVVDPEAGEAHEGSVTPLVWTASETLTAVGYAFAEGGELFVVLDSEGGLTFIDTHDWDVSERVQVTESTSVPTNSRFELTVSGDGHFIFVSDPTAQQIKVVDAEELEVVDTFELDFVPHKLVWLGVADADDDHHHHH